MTRYLLVERMCGLIGTKVGAFLHLRVWTAQEGKLFVTHLIQETSRG